MIKSSIDYLSGVGIFSTINQADNFIRELCNLLIKSDEYYIVQKPTKLGKQYSYRVGSVFKLYGGLRIVDDEYVEMALQAPGSFCRAMNCQKEGLKLFTSKMRVTRIDPTADDWSRRITQNAVNEIGNRGDYIGMESYKLVKSKGSKEDDSISTCYFGGSNKSLRFYNAEFMHGEPFDRWETTYRGEYSQQASEIVLEDLNNFEKTLGGLVTGSIDFKKREGHWDSFKRYQFWESIRSELPEIKLKAPEQEFCLKKSMKWLESQAAPTLGMLKEGLGRTAYLNYMEALADRGTRRFKEHHQAIVRHLKNHGKY